MPSLRRGAIDRALLILYSNHMEVRRVLIVGDMLFAEMLAQLMAQNAAIEVIGAAPDLASVKPFLTQDCPDAVVYARKPNEDDLAFSRFITENPDLPVLCTELGTNAIQVVISHNIKVRSSSDLIAAIQTLQKRG